jgi:hypothetical protein
MRRRKRQQPEHESPRDWRLEEIVRESGVEGYKGLTERIVVYYAFDNLQAEAPRAGDHVRLK